MKNLFDYIDKYGNLSFVEKKVTDIDILIFSQILYLNYDGIFENSLEEIDLSTVWQKAKKQNNKITFYAMKKAFKIMENISIKKRYKDIILKNYVYHVSDDTQFGAITIIIPNNYIYVVFEGTDDTLEGWEEDFKLSYIYPTESQKLAAIYLNDTIKLLGKKVVICGHSKGGNLALVAGMNTNIIKKSKIKKIYSFDGPGLKDEEFKSLNYRLIKRKLINIVPNGSIIGLLLNQEKLTVVKSIGVGLFGHSVTTWLVNDDKFIDDSLNLLSQKFHIVIKRWLKRHTYEERKQIIEEVFGVFENVNIKNLSDIKLDKLDEIYDAISSSKNISNETKELIIKSLKLLVEDFKIEIINEGNIIKNKIIDKYLK